MNLYNDESAANSFCCDIRNNGYEVDVEDVKNFKGAQYRASVAPISQTREYGEDELFQNGVTVPIGAIAFESHQQLSPKGLYIAELVRSSEERDTIQFRNPENNQILDYRVVFNSGFDLPSTDSQSSVARDFDELVMQTLPQFWCRRWHNGIGGRKWRWCGGADCPPGPFGSRAVLCLQVTRKHI